MPQASFAQGENRVEKQVFRRAGHLPDARKLLALESLEKAASGLFCYLAFDAPTILSLTFWNFHHSRDVDGCLFGVAIYSQQRAVAATVHGSCRKMDGLGNGGRRSHAVGRGDACIGWLAGGLNIRLPNSRVNAIAAKKNISSCGSTIFKYGRNGIFIFFHTNEFLAEMNIHPSIPNSVQHQLLKIRPPNAQRTVSMSRFTPKREIP